MVSPLTKGNVTFSVLEFTSLVMFAATGYNKVKYLDISATTTFSYVVATGTISTTLCSNISL